MTVIGFVGLGIMGRPMAVNLRNAGYDVVGTNRSSGKVQQFVAEGGRGAETIAEAVRGAEVVITMLPDSPDVEDAVLGEDGVFANAEPGALLIDCSSISPDTTRKIAETGAHQGFRVLDAPVSGGEAKAIDGTLSIMVGGDQDAFNAAEGILNLLGTTVTHVGEAGSGQTVKIANQLIVAGNIALLAEAVVLLEAQGVDIGSALRVLGGGLAGSAVLDAKGEKMREREFSPGFRLELHDKDLRNLESAARSAGIATPVGALVTQLVAAANAQGSGGLDHSALFAQIARLNGRD